MPPQGPEADEETESEFSITQLRERAKKQQELQKKMMGDGSDEEEEEKDGEKAVRSSGRSNTDDAGCSWGMGKIASSQLTEHLHHNMKIYTCCIHGQLSVCLKKKKNLQMSI